MGEALGYHFTGHEAIPHYMVMVLLIVVFITAGCLFVRSRLSVENPGKLQIVIEDGIGAVLGLLDEWIGPKGHRFLPLIATLGLFILIGNYMGLVPGPDGADEQHQRHARVRAHDLGLLPLPGHPGAGDRRVPQAFGCRRARRSCSAPLMLPIEIISHTSRG